MYRYGKIEYVGVFPKEFCTENNAKSVGVILKSTNTEKYSN